MDFRRKVFSCIPQRYMLAFFGFTAIINAYTMRACLTMTLTKMNHPPATRMDPGTKTFEWSHTEEGFIISSFYIGYLVMHLPGGCLADKYGGKWVLAFGILSTSVLTLVTPELTYMFEMPGLIAIRILIGLGEGVTFPALSVLMSAWIPLRERARLGALIFGGGQMGTVIGFYVTALLLDMYPGTWAPPYYLYGAVGVLWTICFLLLIYNSPSKHPYISDDERSYLEEEMGQLERRSDLPSAPWLQMMRSKPLCALLLAQFGHDWGFYAMNSDINKYYKDVLKLDTKANGVFSALPFAVMWVFSVVSGMICDWLVNSGRLSVTSARKWFTTVGAIGPAILLMIASYVGKNVPLVVTLMVFCIALLGLFYPGLKVNPIDLAPNYAGVTMGLVNGFGSTAGIIAPSMAGLIAHESTLEQWRSVFWVAFVILVLTSVVFMCWGSGEIQPWNDPDPNFETPNGCCMQFCPCIASGGKKEQELAAKKP